MEQNNNQKKYLIDVVSIRLLLIFLLIFYHSFCIYSGNWSWPFLKNDEGFVMDFYKWLAIFSHGFQLEFMTFISGIIWGYICKKNPNKINFNYCVIKKAKRILLPCIIFSLIYLVLFGKYSSAWYNNVYNILNGCGHLWYLPMIFWCYIFMYLREKYICISDRHFVAVIFLIGFMPLSAILPFRIGLASYYFLYFYLGYLMLKHELNKILKIKSIHIIFLVLTYILVGCFFKTKILEIELNWLRFILYRSSQMIGNLAIIGVIYKISNMEIVSNYFNRKPYLIKLSGYCYGVYIYQQFILVALYYHTNLPNLLGPITLPWLACIITILLSLLLCHYTLKTRFGRFLIG